jgi:hypothetical protein
MPKICDMEGVREYGEGYPVELWRDDVSGRLVIRAFNEGHHNDVVIDLWDILEWAKTGPRGRFPVVAKGDGPDGDDTPGN